MKKKIILLCFISLLLIGCGKGKKPVENTGETKNVQTIEVTNREGKKIEVSLGEKCQEIIEKMGFSYEKSYDEKEKIKLGNCKVNGDDSEVTLINYKVGHYTIDSAYAMVIQCETKNGVIDLAFDSAFSSNSIAEMKLEEISLIKK